MAVCQQFALIVVCRFSFADWKFVEAKFRPSSALQCFPPGSKRFTVKLWSPNFGLQSLHLTISHYERPLIGCSLGWDLLVMSRASPLNSRRAFVHCEAHRRWMMQSVRRNRRNQTMCIIRTNGVFHYKADGISKRGCVAPMDSLRKRRRIPKHMCFEFSLNRKKPLSLKTLSFSLIFRLWPKSLSLEMNNFSMNLTVIKWSFPRQQ